MKTIEKRAEEYVEDIYIMPEYEYDSIDVYVMSLEDAIIDESRCAFIQGATEQHKIDIENACEAYCNVVCQAEKKSGKRCYWRVQNERCPELESFAKAMECEE